MHLRQTREAQGIEGSAGHMMFFSDIKRQRRSHVTHMVQKTKSTGPDASRGCRLPGSPTCMGTGKLINVQ